MISQRGIKPTNLRIMLDALHSKTYVIDTIDSDNYDYVLSMNNTYVYDWCPTYRTLYEVFIMRNPLLFTWNPKYNIRHVFVWRCNV